MKSFLLDIIFPKKCVVCEREGCLICKSCKNKLKVDIRMEKLGQIDPLISLFRYRKSPPLKKLIKLMKYKFDKDVVEVFDEAVVACESLIDKKWIVVPVPLHKRRLAYRGFNQAELIAERIEKLLGLKICDCLDRTRQTQQQAKLEKSERSKNLCGSFALKQGDFNQYSSSTFLLIDDVSTSGFTLNECAGVLKKAGAKKVCALVLARA